MKSIADTAQAAATGGYPQLSAEYIIKANPDFILLADTICCRQNAATVAKRPAGPASRPSRTGTRRAQRRHRLPVGPRITDLLRTVEAANAGERDEPGRARPGGRQDRASRAGRGRRRRTPPAQPATGQPDPAGGQQH